MLSRDQILQADDLPRQEVPVPEWGGSVFVRTMTGTERDDFEAAYLKDKTRDFRARLAVVTVCDESGNPLFTAADIPALGRKSSGALTRIVEAAMELNKITSSDVDQLEGNSSAIPSGGSPSGSL